MRKIIKYILMALTFFAFSYYSLSFGQSDVELFPIAEDIETDTGNFDNNLNATDTDVQKCLDKIDDFDLTADNLSDNTTDDLPEGTSNLYFTNERVDDRVSNLIQDGTGLSWTYDDVNNILTGNVSLSPFTTDDLAEGNTNKYFSGKTQDDLPDGSTYKQYNPANVSITGGTINGVSSVVIGTDPGGSSPLRVGGNIYANGKFQMKSNEVYCFSDATNVMANQILVGNDFSVLKDLQIEYYDYGSNAWATWSGIAESDLEKLFSGIPSYRLEADYTHRKFRIIGTTTGSLILQGLGILKHYSNAQTKPLNVLIEISTDGGSSWTTKVDEQDVIDNEGLWWFTYSINSGTNVLWRFTFDCPTLASDESYAIRWIYGTSAGYPGRTKSLCLGSINRADNMYSCSQLSFLPLDDNSYDLGKTDYRWRDLFLSSKICIGDVSLTAINIKKSSNDQLGIYIENAKDGGRKYALYSTGGNSPFGQGKFVIQDETVGGTNGARIIVDGDGDVGIRERNPSNILTIVQNSATDPIADAWTTYSTRDSKIIINEVERGETDKLLQSFLKVPLHRYKKKLEKPKFTYPAILQKYRKKELSSAFQEYLKEMKEYKKKQTLQKFNNV